MVEKHSPDTPGAIQARLTYLKEKKAVLDELIACLERYSVYRYGDRPGPQRKEGPRRLAGAA